LARRSRGLGDVYKRQLIFCAAAGFSHSPNASYVLIQKKTLFHLLRIPMVAMLWQIDETIAKEKGC
jgi:hypothetical protein